MTNELSGPSFTQSVSEADIDWIICLELNSDAAFRTWFARQVFQFDAHHLKVWRSIYDPLLGESDLLWYVSAPDGNRWMALLENKINAVAQPAQCERYNLRGEQYRDQGHCTAFRTVLISPKTYRSTDSEAYEVRISYEEIRDWLASVGGERAEYLASILTLLCQSQS
ncbi:MAG: hypothetical protein SH850_24225 [Planctomycetaceae bacterium]|nr:hypothetical protein [Planctomycetaceae bacterium]